MVQDHVCWVVLPVLFQLNSKMEAKNITQRQLMQQPHHEQISFGETCVVNCGICGEVSAVVFNVKMVKESKQCV